MSPNSLAFGVDFLGTLLVWEARTESGWIGVALISIGLFYRLIEGQKLSSFGFGPNGVTVELLGLRIDEVERKADAAAESGGQLQSKSAGANLIVDSEATRWSDPSVRIIGNAPEDDNQKNQRGSSAREVRLWRIHNRCRGNGRVQYISRVRFVSLARIATEISCSIAH